MPPVAPPARPSSSFRRAVLVGTALFSVLLVLASCMGEPTAPSQQARFTAPVRFSTRFPELQRNALFASVVTFDRVHVVIKRADGSIAIDTLVDFPSTATQVTLDLNVTLSPGAPASGEPMMLDLGYLNAQNEEVFHGGAPITVAPALPGQPAPPPVEVPVVYTGVGANATTVRISPRNINVITGDNFAFSAVATDASGAVVANTPIAWSSLDVARATITDPAAGAGKALNQRGTARIMAQLINGKADTVTVTVTPIASAIALVSGSGQTGKVGKPAAPTLSQPIVARVTASDGLGVSGVTVNFAAQNGGSVSPSSATTDASGNAQANWTLANTPGAQTATAAATGLTGSPVTFTATGQATVATKLAITTAPASGSSINATTPFNIVVTAQDVDGDPVSSFTGTVTLALAGGPSGAVLAGPASVAAVGGVATFTGVSIAAPGTGFAISAASTGLTGATSPTFNIINGPPTVIALVSGGGQTSGTGSTLTPIVVIVRDAANNPKPGVGVDFAVSAGSVSPVAASTATDGTATANWTLGPNAGIQTLTATSPGLTPLVVSATATTTLNQLAFTQQPPASAGATVALAPALKVEVRNSSGTLINTFNGAVSLALGSNPGGATLGGIVSLNAVSGVATFPNVSLNKAGTGYTLVASATGASNVTSSAFNIVAGPASVLSLSSGNNQTTAPGTALGQPIVAKVADAGGNAVAGVTVNFAVSAGGGSVTPASAVSDAQGLASTAWTIGTTGAQTLSVTSTGLTGSPLTVAATIGAGAAASTLLTPHLDTLTAFTDTRTISAQARDVAGNIVAGSWTWVSRNPGVATVNSAGVVTSVANGTAVIVATEVNGSKDSSTIVVEQRIASINVNPANRSIYVAGAFTFTAQAVDGRGVPMVTQPTFAWTSTAPSVATVNAASGLANGITIGNTQIRATSGSTIGVANLAVLTPITRIDVSYDSTNAPAPDVFTMTSLGDRRMYRAVARDTLLNVMSGVTFTWSSTNGSVALIDSTTPTQARALAAANGVTSIQASAQGVTGSATLNVAQVLASIDLTPLTVTVGVTGTTPMTARGKDANGRYISGGTFTFNSSTPGVATVNGTTGVVTGVANGTSNITATSGQITSNAAIVTVNNSGPSLISFGRDTLGIGRGTSSSIPVFLSKPNAAPVTVNLAVADTFAFWSAASVTIPAGQTSANATLNGRNAGTTRVFATDGSGTGFAGDTAVLAVQANLRLTNSGYSVNANDQLITQALLSDPSPAGGTYVTFSYSVAGKALVSPDPAFIPAGQLAADVVIKGLAQGSTNITPSATGVTGTSSSMTVSAPTLSISATTQRLGQGQYEPNQFLSVPNYLNNPLTINLTSTDTSIATTTSPTLVIAANNYYNYFSAVATGRGTAKIIASASGWTPDTLTIVSTTPMARVTGGTTLNTTSNPSTYTVYAADSVRTIHSRVSSLAIRLSSSDTTVLKVVDTLVTIAPGGSSANGTVAPVGGGTAWLKSTASGHTPDSTLYTVVGPALQLGWTSNRLGAGQEEQQIVYIPNALNRSVDVTFTSTDSSLVATSQVVTIPAGTYYQYFNIRGKAPGTAKLIATASGFTPDTGTTLVTSPIVRFSSTNATMNAYSTTGFSVYSADTTRSVHNRTQPLALQVSSTDTTIVKVDSVSTIPAGQYYTNVNLTVTAVATGTAKIVVTAPGHRPDTATITVNAAKLNLNFTTFLIGARQHRQPTDFYVSIPQSRGVVVPVTLTHNQPTKVTLSAATLNIAANTNYEYFTFSALATGRDTIIASAAGYLPDTAVVIVTTPRLRVSNLPSTATTTSPPSSVTIYVADSTNNNVHYANDTVVVRAVSSDTNVIKPGQPFFRILKDDYYAQPTVIYVGNGTASMTYSDSAGTGYTPGTTNTVTVTGPSLSISGGGMLGVRQQSSASEYYVYTANTVTSALTVNLISTDTRVATVPATVTIPTGQNYAYFRVTAQDTIGTIQIQSTATGYSPAARNVEVSRPNFRISTGTSLNTTSPRTIMYVYAQDQNGSAHEVSQAVTVTLLSSAPGVANIDSTIVTIPAGQYYSSGATWGPVSVGTAQLTASDSRAVLFNYVTGTANVSVVTPQAQLSFSNDALAVGQYIDHYVYVPDNVSVNTTVPIGHSATPRTNTPASVVIPAGQNYVYFTTTGTSIGQDTLSFAPPGHVPAKGVIAVGQGRLDPVSGWPTSLAAGDSVQVTVYTRDQNQTARNVAAATVLTLAPNANIQFVSGGANSTPITSVSVPANNYYVQFWVKGVTAGTGTATISATNYSNYTNTITVTP